MKARVLKYHISDAILLDVKTLEAKVKMSRPENISEKRDESKEQSFKDIQ